MTGVSKRGGGSDKEGGKKEMIKLIRLQVSQTTQFMHVYSVYLERKFFYIQQKTPSFHLYVCLYGNFRKILSSTFIYEPILIKNYMNANIMNTQIFNLIKYDLKGH